MPCTLCHPVAVIPLHHASRYRLDFTALVIGSMTPDFGYYMHLFQVATYAHTLIGSAIICIPLGLIFLKIFHLTADKICHLLPEPHRTPLVSLLHFKNLRSWKEVIRSAASLLIGAWTHNAWDSFTHERGWMTLHMGMLGTPIFIAGEKITMSYLLQQLSTAFGGVSLIHLYLKWLGRHASMAHLDRRENCWRYLLLATITLLSLMVALPFSWKFAAQLHGFMAFRALLFRTAVYSLSAFVMLYIMAAIIIAKFRQEHL